MSIETTPRPPVSADEIQEGTEDLRALSWVAEELRRVLEAAQKAVRRHLREAEAVGGSDIAALDPAVLRGAKAHLHQAAGTLEMIGLPLMARVPRAGEAALQRCIARPALMTAAAADTLEKASFALLDALARMLAGKPVSPVALFPQLAALQTLAAAERVHPADLWEREWSWVDLPDDPSSTPRRMDQTLRAEMESLLLTLMRQPGPAALEGMSALCADLGAGAAGQAASRASAREATLWKLASALFEAQARDLLPADVHTKRIAPRLLSLARAATPGPDVAQRLAQDLLFFCARAQAPSPQRPAPRLDAVRQAYALTDDTAPADYTAARLGRFDPAWIQQARKRAAGAREAWSAAGAGEAQRLSSLGEQFALLADSLQRLYPGGDELARAFNDAAARTALSVEPPPPVLAMEVATAILYIEASLEDADLDHPELAGRIRRLAQRIDAARQGEEPEPLEPWMESLYRRVSDRQTMGSVVQELRVSLSEAEKQIDQFFRDPRQRELLIPVPGQLSAMRGVLSVLGLDQASLAILHLRDDIDALAQTVGDEGSPPSTSTFERLAENLGALSFLIDMLAVQPRLAKSLFRFDIASGGLRSVMGLSARPSTWGDGDEAAAQVTGIPAELVAPAPEPAPAPAPVPAPTSAPPSAPAPGDDDEMREIFVEEAREVTATAQEALGRLTDAGRVGESDALHDLTELRRAFHTLKGSSRMVGLGAFGDAAWSCEQLYNARLAQGAPMDAALHDFTRHALTTLGEWVEALAAGQGDLPGGAALGAAADALRLPLAPAEVPQAVAAAAAPAAAQAAQAEPGLPEDWPEGMTIDAPSEWPADLRPAAPEPPPAEPPVDVPLAAVPTLASMLPDLPSASDLELDFASLETPPAGVDAPKEVAFTLDLGEGSAAELPAPGEPEELDIGMAATLPMPMFSAADEFARLPTPEPAAEVFDFRLSLDEPAGAAPMPAPAPEPVPLEASTEFVAPGLDDEELKVVGTLRIEISMFNIFLNEADELSRRLSTELAEWVIDPTAPPPEAAVVLAHSLAGNSATVGHVELSALARALEHALERCREAGGAPLDEAAVYVDAAEAIRRTLHQFAAGFLEPVDPGLVERLHALPAAVLVDLVEAVEAAEAVEATDLTPAAETESPIAEPAPAALSDTVDPELFPIFAEEAQELLPELQSHLRDWLRRPTESAAAAACMRSLHTFKGGARLSGAMGLGDMAHRLETAIEALLARDDAAATDIEPLLAQVDAIQADFERLLPEPGQASASPAVVAVQVAEAVAAELIEPAPVLAPEPPPAEAAEPSPAPALAASEAPASEPIPTPIPTPVIAPVIAPLIAASAAPAATEIDWDLFVGTDAVEATAAERPAPVSTAVVRVRAPLLDRMVNQAGEVSIARARIETGVGQIKGALLDLTENLERLRRQLRDIEVQAESQISSRLEAAKAASQTFDPLERDRFTRFQELTRMMAESVNDVATIQRGLQRAMQSTEDELATQARLTRSLQEDLLRTRMIEFDSLADRLHRVVRQAARETGKQVQLDIVGGTIEVDRGVLDRMTAPFEHLLRNSVTHGIEMPEARLAAGKDATGAVVISLTQEGNEVALEFRDDGAGLDLPRIRERARAAGLLDAEAQPSDAVLSELIFAPGLSTAASVTELAGRGVGMDVVRSEVLSMGGRIETDTTPGSGTRFRMILPLTTAVTQVVVLRCGETTLAVASTLVEGVRRADGPVLEQAYAGGAFPDDGAAVPFFWLGALLGGAARGVAEGRGLPVVIVRSAAQRVALHVDEVVGNQEVVVKHLGPQLSRLPGLAGITLLASGVVAPIYNPVALAHLYGEPVRARLAASNGLVFEEPKAPAEPLAPLVLVVDDSLTVRRVTQRLLVREGYRVVTAKDGLDAMERLVEEKPAVLLSDIEMPRMDGFDLVRQMRADPHLADLAVIMITSRIAQKHRDHAAELGVDHYLGKPYAEEELLSLVRRYAHPPVSH